MSKEQWVRSYIRDLDNRAAAAPSKSPSKWAKAKAREWLEVSASYEEDGGLDMVDCVDSLAARFDSVREEANRVWQDSLGYATPMETWREVNRKRGEQYADTLAEVRRIVEEEAGMMSCPCAKRILKRLER